MARASPWWLLLGLACGPRLDVPALDARLVLVVGLEDEEITSARISVLGDDQVTLVPATDGDPILFMMSDRVLEVMSGRPSDEELSSVTLRTTAQSAPTGSCRRCTSFSEALPRIFVPGDSCAPPEESEAFFGERSWHELTSDERDAVESVRDRLRLEWPGPCPNDAPAELLEPTHRAIVPIAPGADFWPVAAFAVSDGGLVGAFGAQVASVADPTRRARLRTDAASFSCDSSREPRFPGDVRAAIGLDGGFVVSSEDGSDNWYTRLDEDLETLWVSGPLNSGESELVRVPNDTTDSFLASGKKSAAVGRTAALDLCLCDRDVLECHNLLFPSLVGNERVRHPTLLENGALMAWLPQGPFYFSGIPKPRLGGRIDLLRASSTALHGTLSDGTSSETWLYAFDSRQQTSESDVGPFASIGDRIFYCLNSPAPARLYSLTLDPERMRAAPSEPASIVESATVSRCGTFRRSGAELFFTVGHQSLVLTSASATPISRRESALGEATELAPGLLVRSDGAGGAHVLADGSSPWPLYGGPSDPPVGSIANGPSAEYVLDAAGGLGRVSGAQRVALGAWPELAGGAMAWDPDAKALAVFTHTARHVIDVSTNQLTLVAELDPPLPSRVIVVKPAGRDTFVGLDLEGRVLLARGSRMTPVQLDARDPVPEDALASTQCSTTNGIRGLIRALDVFGPTAWLSGCGGALFRLEVFREGAEAVRIELPEDLPTSDSRAPRPLAITALRALAPDRLVLATLGYVLEAEVDLRARRLIRARHLTEPLRGDTPQAFVGAGPRFSLLRSGAGGVLVELGGQAPVRIGRAPGLSTEGDRMLLGTDTARLMAVERCP
ncbi:MAG: hypothetical protein HYV07_08345 [Deltaproteobacteria bacterium]|nr:hypothetical protein [Deltaproteobacteria bacterium]